MYRISLSSIWIFLISGELSSSHCRHFVRSATNKTNCLSTSHYSVWTAHRSLRVCCIWRSSMWVMWNGLSGTIQLRNEQTEYKQLLLLSTSYKWTLFDQMNAIIFHDWSLLHLQWLFIMRHFDAPTPSERQNISNRVLQWWWILVGQHRR